MNITLRRNQRINRCDENERINQYDENQKSEKFNWKQLMRRIGNGQQKIDGREKNRRSAAPKCVGGPLEKQRAKDKDGETRAKESVQSNEAFEILRPIVDLAPLTLFR